jgi:very-short-patch-repair endonuclease
MPNPNDHSKLIDKFAREFYAQALNLTLSNPLLRFPSGARSTSYLELSDGNFRLVADALAQDDRQVSFIGEDAPPALKQKAIASRRSGATGLLRLEIAMPHERVEAVLRSIFKKHEDFIEKRGLPCAFLTFGMLNWQADDGKPTRSPLILVPVELDTKTDGFQLKSVQLLSPSDRECRENPALREYLKGKFGIQLPRFHPETDPTAQSLSDWLEEEAQSLTVRHPAWEITNEVCFGLFDCGAIAADCDPENWDQPLNDRPLLKRIFLSTSTASRQDGTAHFLPPALVMQADGSQLEALRLVERGSSVVLHGPPGSGKSQTIVNLIAQALGAGKNVLFVAQKPEAAHVVQRRLTERGLDPFCTMLVPVGDSRNTKATVLEGLRKRLLMRSPSAPALERERALLDDHLQLLNDHASALRIVIPSIQHSAREVLAELAVLSLAEVRSESQKSIVIPANVGAFTSADQSLQRLEKARQAIPDTVYAKLGGLRVAASHTLPHDAAFHLLHDLPGVIDSCCALRQACVEIEQLGFPGVPRSLSALAAMAAEMPPLDGITDAARLTRTWRLRDSGAAEALEQVKKAQDVLSATQRALPRCRDLASSPAFGGLASIQVLGDIIRRFESHRLPLSALASFRSSLEALCQPFERVDGLTHGGPIIRLLLRADDFAHWTRIVTLAEAAAQPDPGRAFLVARFASTVPSIDRLQELLDRARTVTTLRSQVDSIGLRGRIPDLTAIRIAQAAIAARTSLPRRWIGYVFDRQYRAAGRTAREVLFPTVSRKEWASALATCSKLREAEDAWSASVARAGLTHDCPSDPIAWEAAVSCMQRLVETGRTARVSASEWWPAVVAFENQQAQHAELEFLESAKRLCQAGDLCVGMAKTLSGTETTPRTIARALRRLIDAASDIETMSSALERIPSTALEDTVHLGEQIAQLRDTIEAVERDAKARRLFADDFRGVETECLPYEVSLSWSRAWDSTRLSRWQQLWHWLFQESASLTERGTAIARLGKAISLHAESVAGRLDRINRDFLRSDAAGQLKLDVNQAIDDIADAARVIIDNRAEIPKLFDLGAIATKAAQQAGEGLVAKFVQGSIPADRLARTYRRTVFESLLRMEPRLAPLLSFDRVSTEDALADLPDLEEEIRDGNARSLARELNQRPVAEGVSTGLVRDFTQRSWIRHLIGLTRPRFEVQDLFRRAREAMRALQPCVIATPNAVSEYLPRDGELFDLLIVDEASQLTAPSAFGSLARSSQAVIVGDPKQLPPTSFFMGSAPSADGTGAADEEDPSISQGVTDVESILDRAISALDSVHLRGHYRSRHHSLIAFSNKRFYDERLVVTPSVCPRDSRLGVVAHHVKDGKYSKGGRNETEARVVAERALKHIIERPKESLGIVAFNAEQADLIELHLENLAGASHAKFDAYTRARAAKEPLFVRNLESVQGDERDVIFISYTYGPDPVTGQVYQRFGPVNLPGGHRRLNVLVTRAKDRVEVFHSMLPNQITGENQGARIMRDYLEYARQTPEYDFVLGEYESEFERQVAEAIERISPELLVRPQVGCDQFRIDLGVSLKSNPNRFILGVECDGATYHRGQDARDRDLIRQMILEHHGWQIHRIWSTAWWKNATAERVRLEGVVQEAKRAEESRLQFDSSQPPTR